MANNDYWAYLKDNNELKHYRTKGSVNKEHKYTDIINGQYVYNKNVSYTDGGDYGTRMIPGRWYKGGSDTGTIDFHTKGNDGVHQATKAERMAGDSKVSAAKARETARNIAKYALAQEQRSTRDAAAKAVYDYKVAAAQARDAAAKAAADQARENARDIAKIKQEAQRNASISKKYVSGDTQQIKKYVKARGRYLEGEAGSRHDNIEAHLGKHGGLAKSGYTITEEYYKNGNFKGHKLTKGGDSRSDLERRIDNASYKVKEGIKNSLKNVKSKTLGAVDSIKRKLAKKR